MIVGDDRFAFAGVLPAIGTHRHAAPAVVVGIDRPLTIVADRQHVGRAVWLAPGLSHGIDTRGGRLAVFLLSPHTARAGVRAPLCDLPRSGDWLELTRAVLEERFSFETAERLLARSLPDLCPIDDRLYRAIDALARHLDKNISIEEAASAARLSESRLMALAREQLGTSLRRYRAWLRTFRVAKDYAAGGSLTHAAHAAGFSSSAHLSAACRDYFGIRPTDILKRSSRILVSK